MRPNWLNFTGIIPLGDPELFKGYFESPISKFIKNNMYPQMPKMQKF